MYNKERAGFLIEQELTLFPNATLSDIFKLFYQNCRGSCHFCPDLTSIKKLIQQEVELTDLHAYNYPDYDISYMFKVSRISIYSIVVGKYDINYIADKFLELSISSATLNNRDWLNEWKEIRQLTLEIYPNIEKDLDNRRNLLKPIHHSNIYRLSYNPHYRICNI